MTGSSFLFSLSRSCARTLLEWGLLRVFATDREGVVVRVDLASLANTGSVTSGDRRRG